MSSTTYPLVNQPGLVFETLDFGQSWVQGSYEEGLRVEPGSINVNLALAEFSFVLPALSADVPGRYPIFTVAAGVACQSGGSEPRRAPDFWCPATASGGVLLHVVYEPSKALFHFGMNAGLPRRGLRWVSLRPAVVRAYTGRVLSASVLIAPNGLYPGIEDPLSGEEELFGELALSRASRLVPWGAHTGNWWVMGAAAGQLDDKEKSLPAGFGLSDVRVTLVDTSSEAVSDTMAYTGGLDHLVGASRADPGGGDPDFGGEEPVSQMLRSLAAELTEETQELALRLPETRA